jgi:predicted DNA binding protein
MRGIRYRLRDFTATAVKEHIRSQIEDASGAPELTERELELVRFVRENGFDWDRYLGERLSTG